MENALEIAHWIGSGLLALWLANMQLKSSKDSVREDIIDKLTTDVAVIHERLSNHIELVKSINNKLEKIEEEI